MADGGGAKCHGMQKSFIVYYNRETIRYGKAARQSTYRYKPFFSSHNASVVFITESHEELWGKSDVMAGGEKKKKEKEISGCSAICPEKNACGWYVASKSPSITPFKRIHSCSGGRETHLQKLMSHCRGYEVDLKRGGSLFSPTQLLRGVKTVN